MYISDFELRLGYCLLDRWESRWGKLLREEGNSCRGNEGCYSLLGLKGVEGARLLCRGGPGVSKGGGRFPGVCTEG